MTSLGQRYTGKKESTNRINKIVMPTMRGKLKFQDSGEGAVVLLIFYSLRKTQLDDDE